MNFEKIEEAYTLLLENTQLIQNSLSTNFYDALIEQNGMYLDGQTDLTEVTQNNQALKALELSKEEWRRAYQFILMKAAQTEPLQANHQFTPDSIGFLLIFLINFVLPLNCKLLFHLFLTVYFKAILCYIFLYFTSK